MASAPSQQRTEILLGPQGVADLRKATVAVFGLGGVGGYVLEGLCRAGVGRLVLADCDRFEVSNLNRQILATRTALGRLKTEVARERIASIDPDIEVVCVDVRLTPDNVAGLVPDGLDGAVDAIDDVPAKTQLLATLHQRGVPVIACMGAGSRLDPMAVRVDDISRTRGCPLARKVRQRLRKMGISNGVRCIYSEENLIRLARAADRETTGHPLGQGSISYMPGIVGLMAAGLIIRELVTLPPS